MQTEPPRTFYEKVLLDPSITYTTRLRIMWSIINLGFILGIINHTLNTECHKHIKLWITFLIFWSLFTIGYYFSRNRCSNCSGTFGVVHIRNDSFFGFLYYVPYAISYSIIWSQINKYCDGTIRKKVYGPLIVPTILNYAFIVINILLTFKNNMKYEVNQ